MQTENNNLSENSSNSSSCDTTNFLTENHNNFHNTSALSANALAVMQFISNSENNSNNYRKRMTVRSAVDNIITHGSQQNCDHDCVDDYRFVVDHRRDEFDCMNQIEINCRRRDDDDNDIVVSSQKCLVRKRLRNNNFLRRIINKTANNQCDAHAKTKDFSIDFLLN